MTQAGFEPATPNSGVRGHPFRIKGLRSAPYAGDREGPQDAATVEASFRRGRETPERGASRSATPVSLGPCPRKPGLNGTGIRAGSPGPSPLEPRRKGASRCHRELDRCAAQPTRPGGRPTPLIADSSAPSRPTGFRETHVLWMAGLTPTKAHRAAVESRLWLEGLFV